MARPFKDRRDRGGVGSRRNKKVFFLWMWCVPSFRPLANLVPPPPVGLSPSAKLGSDIKTREIYFFVGRQYPSFWVRSLVSRSEVFFSGSLGDISRFLRPAIQGSLHCSRRVRFCAPPNDSGFDKCSFTEENKTSMSNRIGIFRSILNDAIVALPFSCKIFVFCSRVPRPIFLFRGNPNVLPRSIVPWLLHPKTNSSSHFPFPSFCLQINAFNPFPNSPKLTDVGLSNLALDLVASAHLIAALGSSQGLLCIHTHIRSNSPGVP